jgi:hypothetical protein
LALTAFVLLTSAAGHKSRGEDDVVEDKRMRKNDYKSVQKPSPRHSSEVRSNEQRRVNTRKIVERVEYEYDYASSEEEERPRRKNSRGRRPPPPPRRRYGDYDDDCYADNEDVDDYGIPIYFFVFTSRPPRPRNGYFVFAFFGGQPPFWFRNKPLTSKCNVPNSLSRNPH